MGRRYKKEESHDLPTAPGGVVIFWMYFELSHGESSPLLYVRFVPTVAM